MRKKLIVLVASSMMLFGASFAPKSAPTIEWTAFKTPKKVGVSGSFDTVIFSAPQSMPTLQGLLAHTAVIIDTKSVNSKHEARDAKLVKFFFDQMNGQMIHVSIVMATNQSLNTAITMNGITKHVTLDYSYKNGVVHAKGTIKMGEFNNIEALNSINKACYDLHEGKTWDDVTISFSLPVKKSK